MLTVYIWNFRGKSQAWGHASVLVGETYISWWPEARGRIRSKLHGNVYDAYPIRGRTLHHDVADEGQAADHALRIHGLDEQAVKDWWAALALSRDGELYPGPLLPWSTLTRNCSTVAAGALIAGGADRYASPLKSWNLVWTPRDVLEFALAVQKRLAR